ncbi:hypothetical protein PAXINDRAFT_159434 [Paxillus involutus ATCC 200175]|nr:hypothetical protein PAXINDRAFT_159434 [Paxillus involutus ATCC 200175]
MANLIRTAKSGSDWTANELLAYNITVLPGHFFLTPDPSLDHIDHAILNSPPDDTNPAISRAAASYLGYLDLAARATQENFINDFAAETLKLLDFNERGITVSTRFIIPLTICGESDRVAQTDVCLIHIPTFVLLVLVVDKTLYNRTDAEVQVIAEAIAAFQFNNRKRKDRGLNPLNAMTIPCITMKGTRPIFYLVPVTTELSNAVITGQYLATQTQVLGKLALKRFLAFKVLARSHCRVGLA